MHFFWYCSILTLMLTFDFVVCECRSKIWWADIHKFVGLFLIDLLEHALCLPAVFHILRISSLYSLAKPHLMGPHLLSANISGGTNKNYGNCHLLIARWEYQTRYLWYFPDNNSTIGTARHNVFSTRTESACNDASRMCNASAYLNGRLVIPKLEHVKLQILLK